MIEILSNLSPLQVSLLLFLAVCFGMVLSLCIVSIGATTPEDDEEQLRTVSRPVSLDAMRDGGVL